MVTKTDAIDAIAAKVNKKYGVGTMVRGSDLTNLTWQRCTTGSVAFDVMLGGGWPLNCWKEIVGNESHGKTVMAIKTLAANQNINPDHHTLWVASEDFNLEWAQTLGMDLSRVSFAMTNVMEEAYDIVIEALDERAADAIVIDSYPALTPKTEWDAAMQEWAVGLGARLTNKFMRKSTSSQRRSLTEADRPCLGLIINQWREKIGVMMGDPRTTPGGKGKNFPYFTRVEVVRSDWIEDGKVKVGQTIKAQAIKNKTAPPRRIGQVDFYFDDCKPFSKGDYDRAKEIATISMAYDIVEQRGAWYYHGEERWQGKDAFTARVREDVGLQNDLIAQINRVIFHVLEPESAPAKRTVRRKK